MVEDQHRPGAPPLDPRSTSPFDGSAEPFPPSPPIFGSDRPALPVLPTRPLPARTGGDRGGRRTVLLIAVAAVLIALLSAVTVLALDGRGTSRPATSSGSSPGAALDIQALLRKAQPSVVSIQTGQQTSNGVFGAAGSGVIISDGGLILTNAHVISSSTTMQVTLFDGRSEAADLVGSLPDSDIALVKLRQPGQVTPAELGSSADTRVGDDVVAIGNALNLGGPPSVTKGIVSATDRSITSESVTLTNLIQTDAAINPGNSGGPLLNALGQVVGIDTAIISDAQNIGFAIAIDSVKPLIQDIKDGKGTVTLDTAYLGLSSQDLATVPAQTQQENGVKTSDGAFVVEVRAGSAAADAGLRVGDVITAVDGQPVTSSSDVVAAVHSHQAGDSITITYERAGQRATIEVRLRSRAQSGN
jgi:S1-C subfamily serine protease